jgi:hypothetical protein
VVSPTIDNASGLDINAARPQRVQPNRAQAATTCTRAAVCQRCAAFYTATWLNGAMQGMGCHTVARASWCSFTPRSL